VRITVKVVAIVLPMGWTAAVVEAIGDMMVGVD